MKITNNKAFAILVACFAMRIALDAVMSVIDPKFRTFSLYISIAIFSLPVIFIVLFAIALAGAHKEYHKKNKAFWSLYFSKSFQWGTIGLFIAIAGVIIATIITNSPQGPLAIFIDGPILITLGGLLGVLVANGQLHET